MNDHDTQRVSACCDAPVQEHRPEDTYSRCSECGEMAEVLNEQ